MSESRAPAMTLDEVYAESKQMLPTVKKMQKAIKVHVKEARKRGIPALWAADIQDSQRRATKAMHEAELALARVVTWSSRLDTLHRYAKRDAKRG